MESLATLMAGIGWLSCKCRGLRHRLIAGALVLSGLCGWGISYGFEAAMAVAVAMAAAQ
jgi:hypothetical protein